MIEDVERWISLVTMMIVIPYGLFAPDWLADFGNRPTQVPLPQGRAGFLRILRTGLLPVSTARDQEIRAQIGIARRKLARWPLRVGVVCGFYLVVGLSCVVWGDLSPVVPVAVAIAYLPVPWLSRREVGRRLARYDRLEAALDERRRHPPPPPPPRRVPSPPPADLRRPGTVEHPDRLRSERGRFDTGPAPT